MNNAELPKQIVSRNKIIDYIVVSFFFIITCIFIFAGAYLVYKTIKKDTTTVRDPQVPGINEENGNKNNENPPNNNSNIGMIKDSRYPFELPNDSPILFDDIEQLYTKALERYTVSYSTENKSDEYFFKNNIDPYIKLFLAASQYQYEKYKDIFKTNSTDTEFRNNMWLIAYDKCNRVSSSLTEDTCNNVKVIGSISPFTGNTSFYINKDHPDFKAYFVIITGMHETIHLLQYTYSKNSNGNMIPDWYKEGMADGLSYKPHLKKEIYNNRMNGLEKATSLTQLENIFKSTITNDYELNKLYLAYDTATSFFEYTQSKTTLKEYVKLMEDVKTLNSRFTNIFNKTPEEMYLEFLNNT